MNRVLVLVLVTATVVLWPVPSHAAVTCIDGPETVSVSVPGGSVRVGQTETSELYVDADGNGVNDCPSGIAPADKVVTITASDRADWVFDTYPDWNATVTLDGSGTNDTLLVQGYEDVSEYWVTPSTPALDLTLGVAGSSTLVLVDAPMLTTFDLAGGDDTLDLSNWSRTTKTDPGEGSDVVTGSAAADTLVVIPDEGVDLLDGGGGNDVLDLSLAEDPIRYDADPTEDDGAYDETDDYSGFESVWGGFGNDLLVAGPGPTTLLGGDGNDTLVSGPGNDILYGDAEYDIISFERGGPVVVSSGSATGQGTDLLESATEGWTGSPASDSFTVTTAHTAGATIRPGLGNDEVTALPEAWDVRLIAEPVPDGADSFVSPSGGTWDYSRRTTPVAVTLGPGPADDGAPAEHDDVDLHRVWGGRAADTLLGSGQDDYLDGWLGRDTVNGLGGDDEVRGGAGDDLVGGGTGADLVFGDDGSDQLNGGDASDLVRGGTGNDFLDGGPQNDTVYGDAGNDVFDEKNVVNGSDALYGGTGLDKARYVKRSKPLQLSNDGKVNDGEAGEADSIGVDVEWLVGGQRDDTIKGGPRSDRLEGGEGADSLYGWNGNDTLVGGTGEDLLRGGAGKDRLHSKDKARDEVYGGKGSDRARSDRLDLVAQVEGIF